MRKTELITKVSRSIHKVGFQLKKSSPEILVVAGVGGVVASTVLACRATLKLNDVLEESKETIVKIHETAENPEFADKYTEEDSKKDLTITYIQTGVKIAKLYAPAVIVGTVSIGCIVKSHNILKKRNIALAAAYKVVDKSFKEYRGRVVERFGDELDRELRYNIKAKDIETIEKDKDGNESVKSETVKVMNINPTEYSDFARFFDEMSPYWTKDSESNFMFVNRQQNYANEKLRTDGYLFLNDVYDMLGLQRSKAGQIVGWIYSEDNPNGDNYVDFGIFDGNRESTREFVNGYERSILLDFNVDGPIIDRL